MKKVFIDSNVFANYILVKRNYLKSRNKKKFISILIEKNPQAFYSYGIIEAIKLNKLNGFEFFSSDYALSELSEIIIDQICLDGLYEVGTPIKFWKLMRKKYLRNEAVKEEISNDIYQELGSFNYIFFVGELISKVSEWDIISNIKHLLKAHGSPDAFLMTLADIKNIDIFLSTDGELKKTFEKDEPKPMTPSQFAEQIISEKTIRQFLFELKN